MMMELNSEERRRVPLLSLPRLSTLVGRAAKSMIINKLILEKTFLKEQTHNFYLRILPERSFSFYLSSNIVCQDFFSHLEKAQLAQSSSSFYHGLKPVATRSVAPQGLEYKFQILEVSPTYGFRRRLAMLQD
jgi:hypothetical protein